MGAGMLLPRAHEDPRWLNLPEALPQVEVDARHIVQALSRLLDNAIKFNLKHGKI
jgi:signal transduction histidine kinase